MKFENVFNDLMTLFFPAFFIMAVVLPLTVGRKFDRLFKDRRPAYDPYIPFISILLRAQLYAGCMIFNFCTSRTEEKRLYGNYDFRANSTILDKTIAALYFFFGGSTAILALILAIKQNIIPFLQQYI